MNGFVLNFHDIFSRKKACESGFPNCSLTHFTKVFLSGSMLFDFGFLTEEATWIHRILKN